MMLPTGVEFASRGGDYGYCCLLESDISVPIFPRTVVPSEWKGEAIGNFLLHSEAAETHVLPKWWCLSIKTFTNTIIVALRTYIKSMLNSIKLWIYGRRWLSGKAPDLYSEKKKTCTESRPKHRLWLL